MRCGRKIVWLEQGVWHLWLFALIAAALAPSAVQLFGRTIERRVRARTEKALAACETVTTPANDEHRTTASDVERVEGKRGT